MQGPPVIQVVLPGVRTGGPVQALAGSVVRSADLALAATLAIPVALPSTVATGPVPIMRLRVSMDGPGLVPTLAPGQGPLAPVVLGFDTVPMPRRFALAVGIRRLGPRARLTIVQSTPRRRDVEASAVLVLVRMVVPAILYLANAAALLTALVLVLRLPSRPSAVGLARAGPGDVTPSVRLRRLPISVTAAVVPTELSQYTAGPLARLSPAAGGTTTTRSAEVQEQADAPAVRAQLRLVPIADLHVIARIMATPKEVRRPVKLRPTVLVAMTVPLTRTARPVAPRTLVSPLQLLVDPQVGPIGRLLPHGPAVPL